MFGFAFLIDPTRVVQPNDYEDGGYRVHHILAALVNRKVISIKAGICETKLKWRIQPKLLVDRLAEKNSKNKRKLGYVVVFNVYLNRSSRGRDGRDVLSTLKKFTSRLCLETVIKANMIVTVLVREFFKHTVYIEKTRKPITFEKISYHSRIYLHVIFKK